MSSFRLTSLAFVEGGSIPAVHTCNGPDRSPPLVWTAAPAGTNAFALIVDDPDAGGWVHWVVVDLPATTAALEADAARTMSARQGKTSWGTAGWRGPCPPSGTHRYVFTLFALDRQLGLSGSPSAADVKRAMAGHVLGQAVLSGRSSR